MQKQNKQSLKFSIGSNYKHSLTLYKQSLTSYKKLWAETKKEVNSHKLFYSSLSIILLISLFVRVYRLDQLLGFYYDQGRDALVIWRFLHNGDIFLVGPVTGLEGIFLGPGFYYLIAPFYLLGGGDPVWPATFLGILSTCALVVLYILGWKFHSRTAGFLAVFIAGLSYFLVLASRWLSNPTPIMFSSTILLLSLWKIAIGSDKKWWIVTAATVGISMHFESASAIFYIPTVAIFAIWQWKNLPNLKTLIIAFLVFFSTFIPQLLFNIKYNNLLLQNVVKTFFGQKSFSLGFFEVFEKKRFYFGGTFGSKFFPTRENISALFIILSFATLITNWKSVTKNPGIKILLIMLAVPFIGILLYQGNHGNIYDYYMTGVYLPFVLLVAIGLGEIWKVGYGKVAIGLFCFLFLMFNGRLLYYGLQAGVDGPTHISLGNQMQAVDWVFNDANKYNEFNVDVYVPPVIPHTYDYLFLWQGTKRCGENLCNLKLDSNVSVLYTLYEQDPPHPERLKAWLDRQAGIGEIEEEVRFGGITVQRRTRI